MAMPKFPYARGDQFFSLLDAYYRDLPEAERDTHYKARISELKTTSLRKLMSQYQQDKGLKPNPVKHFLNDWLEPSSGNSRMFTKVKADDVDEVMREGFCQAFKEALDQNNWNGGSLPLLITTAWICNASDTTFDVVTLVNPGVTVVALVVTPPPDISPQKSTGKKDTVWVTRRFPEDPDIADVEARLSHMGDPKPSIVDPGGGNTRRGEVGTFRIWT